MEFQLIVKKLKNELSPAEEVAFCKWYDASAEHRAYFEKVKKNYSKAPEPIKTDEAWRTISSKLKKKEKNQYWKIATAAIITGIVVLTGFLQFLNYNQDYRKSDPRISSPIKVGGNKAILTLGNGTEIILTNTTFHNNYMKSNGTQIIYNSPNSQLRNGALIYNYLTVPRGGEFFAELSDGTKVWLNSDSKLKYPVQFTGKSRKVELIYGEAYFEVSPSTEHQGANFVVLTQNQVVEVLGTEFNIKAYKEDDFIATTLVGGKIALTNNETRQQEYLTPNQQLKLDTKTNEISIHKVDPENIICWKNGFFKFKDKSLEAIMTVLSRWYNIEVIFSKEELKNKKFNGVFRKTQHIESILESIEKTQEAAFQVKEKKVIVENYAK